MKTIVKIQNVQVTLGKNIKVLNGVNLELKEGKITGLIGPSGAGKTTLLRVIVGRILATKGQATVFGVAPDSSQLKDKIAYMTQDVSVYKDLSVRQNLMYFGKLYGSYDKNELISKIEQVLRKLELSDKTDTLVKNLSGGQKQRVSLAVSLIGKHKLLILDEPTTGLDPVLRMKLWDIFKELKDSGVSIIISSHAMDEAQRCDDIVLVREGKVIAHDTPAKIMSMSNSKNIEEAFLNLVKGSA